VCGRSPIGSFTELTAHRTLALRDALANDPDVAFLAALHVLCLKLFFCNGRCLVNPFLLHPAAGSLFCPGSAQGRHLMGLDEDEAGQSIDARGRNATEQLAA
jgi:ParB family transcriptional regulator, chromosome partitioning protein